MVSRGRDICVDALLHAQAELVEPGRAVTRKTYYQVTDEGGIRVFEPQSDRERFILAFEEGVTVDEGVANWGPELCRRMNTAEVAEIQEEIGQWREFLVANPGSDYARLRTRGLESLLAIFVQWFRQNNFEFPAIGVAPREAPRFTVGGDAEYYCELCQQRSTHSPQLMDLVDRVHGSYSHWSRRLRDTRFLLHLRGTLEKRINYAKTEETKGFWTECYVRVGDLLEAQADRITRNRERQADMDTFPAPE